MLFCNIFPHQILGQDISPPQFVSAGIFLFIIALQEIFFKIIPPPSKVQWSSPCRYRYCTAHSLSGFFRTNLVPRACDPWEGNEGSGIIRCRKPGILAKIELRIHFNGQSDSSLKRIIPEPSFPSQGSQARGTRLDRNWREADRGRL